MLPYRRYYRPLFYRLVLALVIIGIMSFVYGFYSYRRPLPQTDGVVTVKGLRDEVTIYRDNWGVPHIYATNSADLFFAQGYVEAQDHWWVMETQRHLGRGQLNEIYGNQPQILDTDYFVSALGWDDQAEADWDASSGIARSALQAYSDGINAYIVGRDQGDLAVQYTVLGLTGNGFEVTPWLPSDSLAWAIAYHWQMSGDFSEAMQRVQIAGRFDPAILPTVYQSPVAIPAGAEWQFIGGDAQELAFMPRLVPPQTQAWVIHGSQTDSGKPILVNSVYNPMTIPTPWYEIGLHCLEITPFCPYDVVGISLAGIPGVMVGHNAAIAWGMSVNPTPTQTLSILPINPRWPILYREDGQWARLESGLFSPTEGDDQTRPRAFYRSPQGVVVSELREGMTSALVVSWPNPQPSAFIESMLRVNQAQQWRDFRRAMALWQGAPHTFVYADLQGGIGMIGTGLRSQAQYYPPTANPPKALIAPFGYWEGDSHTRLTDLLQSGKATLESQALAQRDTYQSFPSQLLPNLLVLDPAILADADQVQRLMDYRAWLAEWGGESKLESPYAALFNVWWVYLVEALFDDDFGYATGGLLLERQAVLELLEQPSHVWWDDRRTEIIETRDETLAATFISALNATEDQLGNVRERWRWGDVLQAEFSTESFGFLDLAALLNREVGMMDGDFFSLKGSLWRNDSDGHLQVISAPAWRIMLDLGDFGNSRSILATGQSGHPASPHYADMMELWRSVAYKDIGWDFELIRQEYDSELVLRPVPFQAHQSQDS